MTPLVQLQDICDVRDGTHDSPKAQESGYPLVTSKHLKLGSVDFSSANLISEKDYVSINKRSKVNKYDILVGMIGTVGELAFIDYEPHFAIKNIGLIKTGNELLGRYLFYYLQSAQARHHLDSVLAGSTQKFISLGELRKFPVKLPGEPDQKKVVEILGAIDEKIELNRRMNRTLEKIGYELYKNYFVSNPIAECWEKKSIYDFVDVVYGAPFKSSLFNQLREGKPLIRIRDLRNQRPAFWTSEQHPKRSLVRAGDLLVGMDAEFRPHIWASQDAWLNQRVCQFIPKKDVPHLFVLEAIKPLLDFFERGKIGTTVIHLGKNDIDTFELKQPDKDTMQAFTRLAHPVYELRVRNFLQLHVLAQLRSKLLPKLLSGELRL